MKENNLVEGPLPPTEWKGWLQNMVITKKSWSSEEVRRVTAMVLSLPGAGGGGDVGGAGDWEDASDKQMDPVKRLVANKQGNEIKDSEMADVEEDPELFDKKTGKKLTFQFPDASPDAASRGKGRGKRSGTYREDQEFKCAQCGKKFNVNSNLTRHIKAVHNRELPHKCEVCGKRFFLKTDLQRHISGVHENARPHVCEDCGATYKQAWDLDHHRIKKHTKQWYWNCDVCDKEDVEISFLLPCELKKHMLLHHPVEYKEQLEKEKPAVCPKCQKRFHSEEQVKIHLKKMHNQ